MQPHTSYVVSIFIFYLIGGFLHAWGRGSAVVKSKLNGVLSYRQYVELNAPGLCIRFFLATLGLMYWSWHPDAFETLARFLHWNTSLNVPLNPVTAGAYGMFADTALDLVAARIPMLQREIPPVGGMIVTQKETTAVTTAETTIEKTTVTPPPTMPVPDTPSSKP